MSAVRTLPEALDEAAHSDAGYIFLASGGETRRSYADVYDASRRVARALRALGLGRGDLVALVIGDAEQFLTTLFGASIAGVIPASLYPPATTSDLPRYLAATAGILRSCGARAVVTTAGLQPHFDELRSRCQELSFVVACETLDAGESEPLRTRVGRRHRVRAVHIGVDVGAEGRGRHASQPVGEHRGVQRARGRGVVRRRTSPSAGCRCTTTWASSAWRSARSTAACRRCC